MNRLNHCVCLAWLLAIAGCQGSAPVRDGANQIGPPAPPATVTTAERAELAGITAVPLRFAELLKPVSPPAQAELPPLSFDLPVAKAPMALQDFWVDGSDHYADLASANSSNAGTAKLLTAGAGEISWAVYQVPGLGQASSLVSLKVDTSAQQFGGERPGYWIGLADFAAGNWNYLALTQAVIFDRSLDAGDYVTPAGNAYVLVLAHDSQGLTVERVGFTADVSDWQELELAAGPNAGWTPALDFALSNNPVVVYSDLGDGIPYIAIGDRTHDLLNKQNWIVTKVDPAPQDQGTGVLAEAATWLDVLVDAENGQPRVSMLYVGVTGGDQNTRAGCSVYNSGVFLNYRFGWIDGGAWTTIDRRPTDGVYGIVCHAENANVIANPPFDMEYRTFEFINASTNPNIERTYGFGEGWLYPHLRYKPGGGNGAVAVAGSSDFYEAAKNDWINLFEDAASGNFGSVGWTPGGLMGSTFNKTNGGASELIFVAFDASQFGTPEVVDAISAAGGAEMARTSQLAFDSAGNPAIAYTINEGSGIRYKFARLDGANWQAEYISPAVSTPTDPEALVVVDLTFDSNDVPAVCFNVVDGTTCTLRFAIRGG